MVTSIFLHPQIALVRAPLQIQADASQQDDVCCSKPSLENIISKAKNPSIYNILHWFAWTMVQRIVNQGSDVPRIIFFHHFLDLGHSKLFIFIFVIFRKLREKTKRILAKNFARNDEKKIIHGTSDTWSTIRLDSGTIIQANQRNIL